MSKFHYPIENEEHDNVNSPNHYQGKVECIDCIESATAGLNGIEAFCTGNAIKYLYRWKKKNGIEDLKKAKYYIDKIISIEGK
jgi:hypothetical protein